MAGKKVNHILISVFIIASVALIIIDIIVQPRSLDKPIKERNDKIIVKKTQADSTIQLEEEIRLPVDFQE